MDSDAISDISEVTSKSTSKKSRFSRSAKKSKDKSKDSQRKSQTSVHSVFGRGSGGSKNSSSSTNVTISTPNGSAGNPATSLPSLDETEVVGSAEDVVAGITGDQEDPAIRFAGEGVVFKAKLIGIETVTAPRGDAMCKTAMSRLKAIVKGTGAHKKKILLSISLSGLTLMDEKTKETISHHPIPLISYISRDTSDSRAFGFVYGTPHDGHQFIGIKTEKAAIPVMQTIADLFTYVYEKRKKEKSSNSDQTASTSTTTVGGVPLSFSAKEEFSEQKVNAAWSKTEPQMNSATNSSIDPLSTSSQMSNSLNSNLPALLPPPNSAFFARTSSSLASDSRASTLSSLQRSDVLAELRSMRHVINSVNTAAGTSNSSSGIGSSCDRYATWESFHENDYSELSINAHTASDPPPPPLPSKQPSAGPMVDLSHTYKSGSFSRNSMSSNTVAVPNSSNNGFIGSTSDFSALENRPSSARSSGLESLSSLDKGAGSSPLSSYSSRFGGIGQVALRGANAVPSPPSSPRSTAGSFNSNSSTVSRARARPRRTFEQPNQVALPPPSAVSLVGQNAPARGGLFSASTNAPGTLIGRPSNAPGGATMNTAMNTTFPSASEPDLFSSLNFDTFNPPPSVPPVMNSNSKNNSDGDKFEANFDAMFPSFSPLNQQTSSTQSQHQQQHQHQQQQPQLLPPPSQSKQVSFSDTNQTFGSNVGSADLFGGVNSQNENSSNKSTSSFGSFGSSSSSSSSADRYACFKEIQELANIPSVFDQASSGSDSDTFVGSPPSIVSTNESTLHLQKASTSTPATVATTLNSAVVTASLLDLEGGKNENDNWNCTSSTSNVPLNSANDADEKGKSNLLVTSTSNINSTTFTRPSGISILNDPKQSSTHVTSTASSFNATLTKSTLTNMSACNETQENVNQHQQHRLQHSQQKEHKEFDTKYKDTATSPGTPPDVQPNDPNSSHEILHNSQNCNQKNIANNSQENIQSDSHSITNTRDDPFGMKSLLHDLNTIDQEVTATFESSNASQVCFILCTLFTNDLLINLSLQSKCRGPEEKANRETNERMHQKEFFGRPNMVHSNAQTHVQNSPLNICDRPPSSSSTASSFRNPFTDDDDSEYTSATASNSTKQHPTAAPSETAAAAGAFGQPAWPPSLYDRSYEHASKSAAMVYQAHMYHDQQSHLYHPRSSSGSGSYMMPQVCAAAHGCECQSCSTAAHGAYACYPPPHAHAIYCQMHPSDLSGHPNCVYCRSAPAAYLAHPPPPHPHPHPHAHSSHAHPHPASHSHAPPLGPTEFGPSFDFGSDFDPKSPPPTADGTYGQLHQSYTGTNSSQREPSESDSTRSLSPSNPFNPIVNTCTSTSSVNQVPTSVESSSSGLIPPPRPPARSDPSRGSNASLGESDIPPPLLPKRKTPSNASSIHSSSGSPFYQQQQQQQQPPPPPPPPPQVAHQYFHHHGYPVTPHPHHMVRHGPPPPPAHYSFHGNDVYGYISAPPVHLAHSHAHHAPHPPYPPTSGMINAPPVASSASSSPGPPAVSMSGGRKRSLTKYNPVERRVSFENAPQSELPQAHHGNYPLTRQQSQPVSSAFDHQVNETDPFDPFNVNFVEEGLNQVMKPTAFVTQVAHVKADGESEVKNEKADECSLKTSTPLNSESASKSPQPAVGENGKSVSTIKPTFDDSFTANENVATDVNPVPSVQNSSKDQQQQQLTSGSLEVSNVSDTVFNDSNSSSLGNFDTTGYTRLRENQELASSSTTATTKSLDGNGQIMNKENSSITSQNNNNSMNECNTDESTNDKLSGPFKHFGQEHVSPPERNIFQHKDDPFADDDFFAQ